jgi:hypothetical protein
MHTYHSLIFLAPTRKMARWQSRRQHGAEDPQLLAALESAQHQASVGLSSMMPVRRSGRGREDDAFFVDWDMVEMNEAPHADVARSAASVAAARRRPAITKVWGRGRGTLERGEERGEEKRSQTPQTSHPTLPPPLTHPAAFIIRPIGSPHRRARIAQLVSNAAASLR